MRTIFARVAVLLSAVLLIGRATPSAYAESSEATDALVMVIMDPLAAPLACPCVKGYAQRDYDKLAQYLETATGRKVRVVFDESLESAIKGDEAHRADLVIGKKSVIEFDARAAKLTMIPAAALTDLQGATWQTGMFVVEKDSPAKTIGDLAGFQILFGTADCDEKYAAAIKSLKSSGITPPESPETCESCSDGAAKVVEAGSEKKFAAVISSYAKPLLEGCGTIKKGDLRVVGETGKVPFIEAYVSGRLSEKQRQSIVDALLSVKDDLLLCRAIESRDGFVAVGQEESGEVGKSAQASKKN